MAHTEKDDRFPMEGIEDSAGKKMFEDFLEKIQVNGLGRQKDSR